MKLLVAVVSLAFIAVAWAQSRYVTAAVAYANAQCRSESCGSVPDCQCAEFAARAIAAGGCLPGLSSTSSKLSYARFMPDGGTWKSYTYDLRVHRKRPTGRTFSRSLIACHAHTST